MARRRGDFVQVSPVRGQLVVDRHRATYEQVFRIDEVLLRQVYGRRAFVITSGELTIVVWPSQVRKVRHPTKKRKRREHGTGIRT